MRIKNLTKFIFVGVLSMVVLSGGFGFSGVANAETLNTGWLNPTNYEAFDIGEVSWVNPENAFLSDDIYTTAEVEQTSGKFGGFGFTLPIDAEVIGIEVLVEAKAEIAGIELSVKPYGEGGFAGSSKLAEGLSEVEAVYELGGIDDNWGVSSWDILEVNDYFSIRLQNSGFIDTIYVDNIQVRITYETTDVCDSSHLGLCLTELDCDIAGGFWYSDTCNVDEELPVVASASFVEISSSNMTGLLGWIGNLFTGLSSLIMLAIGLPLAFWFIKKTIGLVKNKK